MNRGAVALLSVQITGEGYQKCIDLGVPSGAWIVGGNQTGADGTPGRFLRGLEVSASHFPGSRKAGSKGTGFSIMQLLARARRAQVGPSSTCRLIIRPSRWADSGNWPASNSASAASYSVASSDQFG